MRARLASTVFGLMNSAAATSRLVIPVAANSATRCSDGVNTNSRLGATLVRASSARARSAHRGVPMASKGLQRVAQSGSSRFLLALTSLELSRQELRAGALERHGQPVVFGYGVLGHPRCRRDVAGGGQPHAAAARADGQHPRAAKSGTVLLELLDERRRVIVTTQPDHRLDGVGNERGGHDLAAGKRVENVEHWLQIRQRLCVVAERNLEEAKAHS